MKRCLLHSWTACLLLLTAGSLSPLFGQGMSLDLGKTTEFRYLKLVGNTAGGDGEILGNIKIFPEYCAKNIGTTMYFAIDDNFTYKQGAGKFAIINVEYYDTTGCTISVVYDAIGNANKVAGTIVTAGTRKWVSQRFFLDDAYFANSETNGADFKLVCTAGKMFINGVSVVPFDAYIDYYSNTDNLDSADVFNMIYREKSGGDSKFHYELVNGEPVAVSNLNAQYLYCTIEDTVSSYGTKPYVFVSVVYYDDNPANRMRLQYDGPAAFTSTPWQNQKGWNNYRTYTFEVSDGNFKHRESGGSDLRVQTDLAGFKIKQIMVGFLPRKPLPNPTNIGNWTAYKALESPVVDGSLKEWSWNRQTLTDWSTTAGDRTDEYFRTWFLNSENVPVVEVGEPKVVAPASAGLWDKNDLTGSVRMLWDNTNLYIAAVVKDNVVDVAGSSWKEKDGIGFYIDVSHSYNGNTPMPIKDDPTFTAGEHFIFLPASSSDLGIWKHSTSQTGEALPNTVKKSVVLTDSGYVIEASIPLSMLKDSYAWTPGAGGKDDFNPLFGWTLNDADNVGATSGRLMYGAHSDDDEFWGTLTMAPIPLLDKGIMVDFGNPNYENLVTQVEKGGDGAVDIVEKEGKNCAFMKNGYIYLAVNDTAIGLIKHPRVTVMVEYFDSQDAGQFRIQYDGAKSAYTDSKWITCGNTQTWKVAIFDITDAVFMNHENGGADLRINCSTNKLYVNQVRFAVSDIWIDLGVTNTGWGLTPTNLASDGARTATTVGGVECVMNDRVTAANANYLYHTVVDSLILNGDHKSVWVSFEYYDTTSTTEIGLNYDGMSNQWSNGVGNVFILGSNQWKIHTFFLEDARFNNLENGGSDFRIGLQGGTAMFINRIMIGSLDGLKYATPTTGIRAISGVPHVFALEQNYPNPFNPTTTIRFSLAVDGLTSLKVYNILGQEVATLVNEMKHAGSHSVQWNASSLTSGVYFTRLTQNDKVSVHKTLLMK
jgi:hypothetical protein